MFIINADGSGSCVDVFCNWSVKETRLTLHIWGSETGSVTWKIESGKLFLSNSTGDIQNLLNVLIKYSPYTKI